MLDFSKFSISDAAIAPLRIISRSTGPSADVHSVNAHVIAGALLRATQCHGAVVSPALWAASYTVGTWTIFSFSIVGSTFTGGHAPVCRMVPLVRRSLSSARTPIAMLVWLGHVTVGFTVAMRALAPFCIRRRSVGIGSFGSSRA